MHIKSSVVLLSLVAIAVTIVVFFFDRIPGRDERSEAIDLSQVFSERVPDEKENIDEIEPASAGRLSSVNLIRGIIQAPDGTAIAGAHLRLFSAIGDWRQQEPISTATSATDGLFSIPAGADSHSSYLLVGEATGYGLANLHLVDSQHLVSITLPWEPELFGFVQNSLTGFPLANASIICGTKSTATNREGFYQLKDVDTEVGLVVRAKKDGFQAAHSNVTIDKAIGRKRVDFQLHEGTPIAGIVYDRETEALISGAAVRYPAVERPVAETDHNGRCFITLAGTQQTFVISADEYCDLRWTFPGEGSLEDTLRFPMIKESIIEGTITDEAGDALAGVQVDCSNEESPAGTELAGWQFDLVGYAEYEVPLVSSRSDREGRFHFSVVASDRPYYIYTYHPQYADTRIGPIAMDAPGGRSLVPVELAHGATVRGTVQYNGFPLRNRDVVYQYIDTGRFGGNDTTDAGGEYELNRIEAGQIEISVDGFASGEAILSVTPGDTYVQDFSFDEELATISGRVTLATGAPLPNIAVFAKGNEATELRSSRTGADGTYSIKVPPGQSYVLEVNWRPARPKRYGVSPGSTGVDFVVSEIGSVKLRLVDELTNRPVLLDALPPLAITWKEHGSSTFQTVRTKYDAQGTLMLRLPVGLVDLLVCLSQAGFAPQVLEGVSILDKDPPDLIIVPLSRGLRVTIEIGDQSTIGFDQLGSHLLFLVRDSERHLMRGPYPDGSLESNHRINGVNIWLGSPVLLSRLLNFDPKGTAVLSGITPGVYSILGLPDTVTLRPADLEIHQDPTTVIVHAHPK